MMIVYTLGLLVFWRAYQLSVLKRNSEGEVSESSEREVLAVRFRKSSEEHDHINISSIYNYEHVSSITTFAYIIDLFSQFLLNYIVYFDPLL